MKMEEFCILAFQNNTTVFPKGGRKPVILEISERSITRSLVEGMTRTTAAVGIFPSGYPQRVEGQVHGTSSSTGLPWIGLLIQSGILFQ